MNTITLKKIDQLIIKYKAENLDNIPLYIIGYPDDVDVLMEEIKLSNGVANSVLVTTYKDMKIVKHDLLEPGEFRLSNDLPETGS